MTSPEVIAATQVPALGGCGTEPLLSTPDETGSRFRAVEEARRWVGVPFVMNGMTWDGPGRGGIDCSRLALAAYRAAGFDLPTNFPHFRADWGLHANEERLLAILERYLRYVAAPAMGDLAVFRLGRAFSHCALVVRWPQVIHVLSGKTCEYADASKTPLARLETRFMSPWRR